MWSLLGRSTQLTIVVAAAFCLAWACDAAYQLLTGQTPYNIKLISLFAFIIGGVLAGVAEVSWRPLWRRFPILQRKAFPDLNGSWTGTLVSTWVDPATGLPKSPIPTDSLFVRAYSRLLFRSRPESPPHTQRDLFSNPSGVQEDFGFGTVITVTRKPNSKSVARRTKGSHF